MSGYREKVIRLERQIEDRGAPPWEEYSAARDRLQAHTIARFLRYLQCPYNVADLLDPREEARLRAVTDAGDRAQNIPDGAFDHAKAELAARLGKLHGQRVQQPPAD